MGWDAIKFIKDTKAKYMQHDSLVSKEDLYLCLLITERMSKEEYLEKIANKNTESATACWH